VAQFADRHAVERKPMGPSKRPKKIDRFDYFLGGRGRNRLTRRRRKMGDFFEQTGGVCINPYAMCSSPAGKFGLKLAPDLNSDSHSQPFPLYTYATAAPASNQAARGAALRQRPFPDAAGAAGPRRNRRKRSPCCRSRSACTKCRGAKNGIYPRRSLPPREQPQPTETRPPLLASTGTSPSARSSAPSADPESPWRRAAC